MLSPKTQQATISVIGPGMMSDSARSACHINNMMAAK
jgi:hypothetical protein